MATAVKLHDQGPREGRRVFISLRLIFAFIALLITGSLVWHFWSDSQTEHAMKALVEAFSKNRKIEPRLSGGFHAGEHLPEPAGSSVGKPRSGIGELPGIDLRQVHQACDLVEEAASENDDAEAQMAYARLKLLQGDTDPALARFEKVSRLWPGNAEAQNDLGVCLIERGDIPEAIDRFDRALEINPQMPEALLNRALCYNRLHLREAARDDLSLLETVERDPGWRKEVNERLEAASKPFPALPSSPKVAAEFESAYDANNLEAARSLIYNNAEMMVSYAVKTLTINYLEAAIENDLNRAARATGLINMISKALKDTSNETFLGDMVSHITSLRGSERVNELEWIRDYGIATTLLNTDIEQAQSAFNRLRESFSSSRNEVYEEIATYYYARCQYSRHEYRASIETLKDALRIIEKHQWPTLKIQALLQMSIAHANLGEDSIALDKCETALKLCRNGANPRLLEAKTLQDMSGHYIQGFFDSGMMEDSIARTQSVAATKKRSNLPMLEAKTLQYMSAHYIRAVSHSEMSEDLVARTQSVAATGKRSNLPMLEAKTLQFMSVPYWQLGNLDKGLELIRAATDLLLAYFPNPDDLAHNYLLAADLYRLRGHHRLSLEYATQSFRFAWNANRKDHNRSAQALSLMAVEQARLKKSQVAEQSLAQAIEHLNQIQNAKQRNYTGSLVYTRGGEAAALAGDTDKAIQYYSNAEEMAASAEDNKIATLRALRGRAEAQIAAGKFDEAEADLQKAITLIDQYRERIPERENRNDFFEASQSVFEQRLLLNLRRRGLTSEALDLSEESRARTLLDDLTLKKNAERVPLKMDDVQARLPEGMALLVYSVTSQDSYIFLVTKTSFEARESKTNTEEIDDLVRDLLSDIDKRASEDGLKQKGRSLYEKLLGPIEGLLGGRKRLCIVPDKALHSLPFNALVDRSDKYLLESYTISYAPSASVLVKCIEEGRKKESSEEERMLPVGDPVIDRASFPNLRQLPDSEREARTIASLYRSSPLIGPQATEARVREEMKVCDIAHLAMHCLVEEKMPGLAALVLSGPQGQPALTQPGNGDERKDDGLLHLNEIYNLKLPRMKMVILSACESALGQYYRGEGMVSLARPFIAVGVPTVIASFWPVESKSTGDLMIAFHKNRKENNRGAAEALRLAQLELAGSEDYSHPYFWAPFMVIGYSK